MYVGKVFRFKLLWHFARKNLFRTMLVSIAAVILYKGFKLEWIAIPFLPIGTIGTAVAFFVGFKNNQAYDRLWEARRLWGGITNTSRNLTVMLNACLPDKKVVREMLLRHIAWVNILRLQLRRNIPWATSADHLHQDFVGSPKELEAFDDGLRAILTENGKMHLYENLRKASNTANLLLKVQTEHLHRLKTEGKITEFEHSDLVKQINELFNLQGGCERIKTTPLFRQYSVFSRVFVVLFIFLLPFGLMRDLDKVGEYGALLVIPFSMLISWVFFTMEQIGEFSENPFDNSVNDIPISTICRNIEVDIKEMLGDETLPPRLQPENDILL